MGMLDALTPFSEHFKEGEVFTLQEAKLGNPIKTDFGNDRPAQFKIEGKWYTAFGQGLTSQIERMDDDDKEAMSSGQFRCKMVRTATRKGQELKLLVPPDWTPDEEIPF